MACAGGGRAAGDQKERRARFAAVMGERDDARRDQALKTLVEEFSGDYRYLQSLERFMLLTQIARNIGDDALNRQVMTRLNKCVIDGLKGEVSLLPRDGERITRSEQAQFIVARLRGRVANIAAIARAGDRGLAARLLAVLLPEPVPLLELEALLIFTAAMEQAAGLDDVRFLSDFLSVAYSRGVSAALKEVFDILRDHRDDSAQDAVTIKGEERMIAPLPYTRAVNSLDFITALDFVKYMSAGALRDRLMRDLIGRAVDAAGANDYAVAHRRRIW